MSVQIDHPIGHRGAPRVARLGALAVIFSCIPATARAVQPPGDTRSLPCRPTIACTADLVAPGALEIESGALYRRLGNSTRQWTFPFLLKVTLVEWAQLQVGSNGYTVASGASPAQYLDDLTVGMKFHLADQTKTTPSLSFSATASLPTFDAEGYSRTYDAFFVAYVTKDFGPLHADLNLGEDVWRVERDPRPREWAALAVSMNLPPPFGIMGEGYYFSDASPIAARDGGLLLAISHTPAPWLVFDFGGDVGMFPSTRTYSVFVGMTIVPVVFWRPRLPPPPR